MNWRAWAFPVGLVAIAEAATWITPLDSDTLAPPRHVAVALYTSLLDGTLLRATEQTMASAAIGLALGATTGVMLGFLLGLSPTLARIFFLPVEMLRPMPAVALIPVTMLAFGFGYRMEVAIVFYATIWPILILSQNAVANVEPRLIEVARTLRIGFASLIWKVILPAAAPRIFTALRFGVGLALIVAVTVEIAANPQGLGYGLMIAEQSLRPEVMLAFLVWVGCLGWAINEILIIFERRLFAYNSTSVTVAPP